jgi:predicted dehydrogenase
MAAVRAPRWGILSTANIARGAFLPALRVAGGTAAAVASRDLARAEQWASENRVDRALQGYQALIDDPGIDAVYIPLPNSMHAEWTIRALQAGKAVLCEKPLCGVLSDTERVLAIARESGTLLWEAFVFPFNELMGRLRSLVADGAIGELREIQSNFHFKLTRPGNIRLSAGLQGGGLRDVGCYPVRLAQEFFGEHETATAAHETGGDGVDIETWGMLGYANGRKLLLSCGMRRDRDTFARLLGTAGQIHVTNIFHPDASDQMTLYEPGVEPVEFRPRLAEPSFAAALRHINAAISGQEEPRLLALDSSLVTARALHDLRATQCRGGIDSTPRGLVQVVGAAAA